MTAPDHITVDREAVEFCVTSSDDQVVEHFTGISDGGRVPEALRIIRLGVEGAAQIGRRSEALALNDARRDIVDEARAVQRQLAEVADETSKACRQELEALRANSVTEVASAVRQATGDDRLASVVASALVGPSSPLAGIERRLGNAAQAIEAAHRRGLDSAVRQLGDVATHLSRLTGTLEANQSSPARGFAYEESLENQLAAVVDARGDRLRDVRQVVSHNGSKKGDYVAELDSLDLHIGIELKDTQVGPSAEAARDLVDQICQARDAQAGLIVVATEAAMPTGLRGASLGLVGDRGIAVCVVSGQDSDALSVGYSIARALALVEARRRHAARETPDLASACAGIEKLRSRLTALAESEARLKVVARDASAESKRIGKLTRDALTELESLAEEVAKADTAAA